MKKILLTFIIIPVLSGPLPAWNKSKTVIMIQQAQSMIQKLDSDYEIQEFIPHIEYNEIIQGILNAQSEFEKENYKKSYFHAVSSIVKIETAAIMAQTRKLRYTGSASNKGTDCRIPGEDDARGLQSYSLIQIIESGRVYEKNTFRTIIPDRNLFDGVMRISGEGAASLDRIIRVMKENPSARMKILGHTSAFDTKMYSARKADMIKNYISGKGVSADRLEAIGLGDNQVHDSLAGLIRATQSNSSLPDWNCGSPIEQF
jgi:outer membrane protein OmpA-like peptidoglycan-associated protein